MRLLSRIIFKKKTSTLQLIGNSLIYAIPTMRLSQQKSKVLELNVIYNLFIVGIVCDLRNLILK